MRNEKGWPELGKEAGNQRLTGEGGHHPSINAEIEEAQTTMDVDI